MIATHIVQIYTFIADGSFSSLTGKGYKKRKTVNQNTSYFHSTTSTHHREMYYNLGSSCPNFHAERGCLMQFTMAPRLQKDKTLNKTHHVFTPQPALITERCTMDAARVVLIYTSIADGSCSFTWCRDFKRAKL